MSHVPDLAKAYEWNDDFTDHLHMREGVKWSDGRRSPQTTDVLVGGYRPSEWNDEPFAVPGMDSMHDGW